MKDENELYTIITGSSKGLGKQFAIECAKRKMNLILVSLPNENLSALCREISETYQVKTDYYEVDLTKRESIKKLAQWIHENYAVNMLINNAGIGGTCIFTDATPEYLDNMIQLNVSAMVLLIRLLLPELKKQPLAYILNVSSLAAFSPLPYKTVYPASKAFIHHFTLGLKAELRDSNVSISVLNPGPIMTNSDVTKRINGQSFYIKLSIMPPEKIARIALNKLLSGKAVIIPGFMNRLNTFLIRMAPVSFRLNVGTSIFKRDLRKKQAYENLDNGSERASWQ